MLSPRSNVILLIFAVIATGCISARQHEASLPTHVEPAPVAMHITARTNVWEGIPSVLARHVTPVLVSIVNQGKLPLRVALDDFALVSAHTGSRLSALQPGQIQGRVHTSIGASPFPVTGFDYADKTPYADGSALPRAPTEGYWYRYGTLMRTLKLPTYDMFRKALPEGVLQPGGRVSGFLYFERLHADIRDFRLRAWLTPDAGAGTVETEVVLR